MSNDTMDQAIPVHDSLDKLYPTDALITQAKRWNTLRTKFTETYGHDAKFVARSPGRVNIIGEHIDYSLYDVLPMGIAADVIIAVSTSPAEDSQATISLANVDPDKFKSRSFSLDKNNHIEIDSSSHEWTNYFKAGQQGALGLLAKTSPDLKPVSMSIMVDGTVPAGGGLSSSAAFVCASALAALYANGNHAIMKKTLVELAIVSERSVGVNSGGMDQSASVCSIRGDALHVSFSPTLKTSAIAFPKVEPALTFMIAQSFVAADKHVTAPVCYNLRVVEVTLAAQFIAASLGLTLEDDASSLKKSLRGLQNAYFASGQAPDIQDERAKVKHMLSLVEKHLSDSTGYDRDQIASKLGISVPELEQRYMSTFPVRAERFQLGKRAAHVFTEAVRVHDFMALMKSAAPASRSETETLLQEMGTLMNETQDSCRDVFECSCPELDELCSIARKHGSYGSRLTGAGWGGCSVHLVPKGKVDDIRAAWEKEYYLKQDPNISGEKLAEAVVVTEPGHGAMIIEST